MMSPFLKVSAGIRSTVCPLLVAKSKAECVSLFENYTDDIIQESSPHKPSQRENLHLVCFIRDAVQLRLVYF